MDVAASFWALAVDLAGERISHIWQGYGSAVFIEFGNLTPRAKWDGSPDHPEGRFSLGVEWSWRIEDDGGILCGSWSEDDLWEPSLARLLHARVASLALFGRLPEVELATSEGLRFVTFSTTDGQPRWHIIDRRCDPARWFTVRGGQLHLGHGSEPSD